MCIRDSKKDIYTLSKELDQKFPNMEKSLSRLIKFLEILKDHHLITYSEKKSLIGFIKTYCLFVCIFVLQKPLFMLFYKSLYPDASCADWFLSLIHISSILGTSPFSMMMPHVGLAWTVVPVSYTHLTSSSIMDYARFNYVAQPGDGVTALSPHIGP